MSRGARRAAIALGIPALLLLPFSLPASVFLAAGVLLIVIDQRDPDRRAARRRNGR